MVGYLFCRKQNFGVKDIERKNLDIRNVRCERSCMDQESMCERIRTGSVYKQPIGYNNLGVPIQKNVLWGYCNKFCRRLIVERVQ